jgi:hypothetical protein
VWERLAALEPADGSGGGEGAGQLEACMAGMQAVTQQRARLQVSCLSCPPSLKRPMLFTRWGAPRRGL